MSDLKKLETKLEKLQAEVRDVEKQIAAEKKRTLAQLKKDINALCNEAGTSVEELFGLNGQTKTRSRRTSTVHKYIVDGVQVDGRAARTMEAFASVTKDGKIDDKKALASKLINPRWLKSDKAAAKQFVRDFDVDPKTYANK